MAELDRMRNEKRDAAFRKMGLTPPGASADRSAAPPPSPSTAATHTQTGGRTRGGTLRQPPARRERSHDPLTNKILNRAREAGYPPSVTVPIRPKAPKPPSRPDHPKDRVLKAIGELGNRAAAGPSATARIVTQTPDVHPHPQTARDQIDQFHTTATPAPARLAAAGAWPGLPGRAIKRFMEVLLPAAIGVAVVSFVLTGGVLQLLRRRAILDHPNDRSSHSVATPRGGGIAVLAVVLGAWAVTAFGGARAADPGLVAVLVVAFGLGVVSWRDDLVSLPPWLRFLAQAAAVAAVLWTSADARPVFQGLLPGWLDIALAAFCWLWFVNLFNFMDGIDAISGVEAVAIAIGLIVAAAIASADLPIWPPLSLAAATLGFLWWNRPPARIFLGDVGSIPLGFLLGWLLLEAARAGLWAAALILPLYYLADASLTLARRGFRGEKVWRAHREHFYQRAVQAGRSHGAVAKAVLVADLALIALAAFSVVQPWLALAGAVIVVAGLMRWMVR